MSRKYLITIGVLAVLLGIVYFIGRSNNTTTFDQNNVISNSETNTSPSPDGNSENANNVNSNNSAPAPSPVTIAPPIDRASQRITKKLFGTYVTPQSSPVSPEKFTGYHTGLDFEILPGEENSDVTIKAICSGPLLQKRSATGYGGVAVQKCTINNQAVTVVYGHLRLSSVTAKTGATLNTGDKIGVLGTGYSTETSGERKHLHLGIHKGTTINIAGYVSTQSALSAWLDPKVVLGI